MEETWVLKTWRRHGCLKHGAGEKYRKIRESQRKGEEVQEGEGGTKKKKKRRSKRKKKEGEKKKKNEGVKTKKHQRVRSIFFFPPISLLLPTWYRRIFSWASISEHVQSLSSFHSLFSTFFYNFSGFFLVGFVISDLI